MTKGATQVSVFPEHSQVPQRPLSAEQARLRAFLRLLVWRAVMVLAGRRRGR